MSDTNVQSAQNSPLQTKVESGQTPVADQQKMSDSPSSTDRPPPSIAPIQAISPSKSRAGAPMFREPFSAQPVANQGPLFPVHTIMVQPGGQTVKRGNYTKAAAAAMNRRPPTQAAYFIQHRRPGEIVDEGPTVKQHLQEQQKQMKEKERMSQAVRPPEETGNGHVGGQLVRTETGQVMKTFTVQTPNTNGGPQVQLPTQPRASPQKRTPARPTDGAPPRSSPVRQRPTQATTSLSANNRKLKVIVSPGVTTTFTTAQKQQLAQAPYVVSTQPLPPTAALPNQIVNQQQKTQIHQPVVIQKVTVNKSEEMNKPVTIKKAPGDKPSEFHVVKTVVPVTTPSIVKPSLPILTDSAPMNKLSEPPVAILEGEEEEIAKEMVVKKPAEQMAKAPRAENMSKEKFEQWVKEVREREGLKLEQQKAEKTERERKKFTEKHIEQKRILDQQHRGQPKEQVEKKKLSQKDLQEQRRQLEIHKRELEMQRLREQQEKERQQAEMKQMQQQPKQAQIISEHNLFGPGEIANDPLIGQQPLSQFPPKPRTVNVNNLGIAEPLNMDDLMAGSNEDNWKFQDFGHSFYTEPIVDHFNQYDHTYANNYPDEGYQPAERFPDTGYQKLELPVEQFTQPSLVQVEEIPPHPLPPSSSLLDEKSSLIDDLFTDKDDSLNKLLSDPNILEDFPDMLNDSSIFEAFDLNIEPLCSNSKSSGSKKSNSPEGIGMSLIDWVTNDDHEIDDGDDLMGLRDETLENSATEYLNVCSEVDFASFDNLDIGPMGDGKTEKKQENFRSPSRNSSSTNQSGHPHLQAILTSKNEGGADQATPPITSVQFISSQMPVLQPVSKNSPQTQAEESSRPRRRPKSPKPMGKPDQLISRAREKRRNDDRSARQKKAEQDAKEKEREKQQIEADRERIKQIMFKEELAIQAEKAAEATKPTVPKPKKKNSSRSKTKTAPLSLPTPSPAAAIAPTQPLAMPPSAPIAPPQPMMPIPMPADVAPMQIGNFEPSIAMIPPTDNQEFNQQFPEQVNCITTTVPPTSLMTSALPATPIASYYPPDGIGQMQQQYYPPEAAMYGHTSSFIPHSMMMPGDYQHPLPYPQQYPPEAYQGPMQQGWYPPLQPDCGQQYPLQQEAMAIPEETPDLNLDDIKVIERTFSRDSGLDQMTETSPAKTKARRSNSFSNGLIEADKELDETRTDVIQEVPLAPLVEAQEVLPFIPTLFEETLSKFVSNCYHFHNKHGDLEKLLLGGNSKDLKEFFSKIEYEILKEDCQMVPTEILYNMINNPQETFNFDEIQSLRHHGVDTTEQVKASSTNFGIEIPQEILTKKDFEVLQEFEWKKLLCQAMLLFTEEEKVEELWYMESQVSEAELAWDKHYAMKMKMIREGILSLLYNNTALIDEFARLAGKMLVTSEERKLLARRLCHHQRNYIRRLQTASKRRSDAEKRRQEMIAAGLVPDEKLSPEKTHVPAFPPKSHKRKVAPNSTPSTPVKRSISLDDSVKKRGRPPHNPPGSQGTLKRKERSVSNTGDTPKKSHKKKEPGTKEPKKKESIGQAVPRSDSISDEKKKNENIDEVVKADVEELLKKTQEKQRLDAEAKREARNLRKRIQRERARERKKAEEEARRTEEAAQAEEVKKKKSDLKRMKGYVYEDVVEPVTEEPPPEQTTTTPDKPGVDPDAPIRVRKTTRRSAQHLNFNELSPRTSPDPEDATTGKRKTGRPRTGSGGTYTPKHKAKNEKTKRRGRPSKELLTGVEKTEEEESASSPHPEKSNEQNEKKTESVEPIVAESSAPSQGDDTNTSPDNPTSEQSEEKERRRPRRAAAAIANSSIMVKDEVLFDEEETVPKKRRRRADSSTPVRQSTRRKS